MPGQEYTLLFNMAGAPVGPPALKVLEVSVDSTTQEFTLARTGKTKEDIGGWLNLPPSPPRGRFAN